MLPCMVTSLLGGKVSAGRIRLHHLERRPSAAPCARLSRRPARPEMGCGERPIDAGQTNGAHPRTDRGTRIRGTAVKIRSVRHNNRKKAFEVQWVMGRDLGPTEVADMMSTVETWYVLRAVTCPLRSGLHSDRWPHRTTLTHCTVQVGCDESNDERFG